MSIDPVAVDFGPVKVGAEALAEVRLQTLKGDEIEIAVGVNGEGFAAVRYVGR